MRGLVNAVSAEPGCRVAIVVPCTVAPSLGVGLNDGVEVIEVRHAFGLKRVALDAALLDSCAGRWRADVLHYPHEWCPHSRRPTVITVQNVGFLHPLSASDFGKRGAMLRMLTRATGSWATAVTAVSESAARLWATISREPVTRIRILPEGISFPALGARPERSGHILGIIGGREPDQPAASYKGEQLLLDAYAIARRRRSNGSLLLAGSLPLQDDAFPSDIRRLGWLPHRELLRYAAQARCVVVPSQVESFGIPAFETTGLGTPTVVLRDTPMAEWLHPHVTVVPPDPAVLANVLCSEPGSALLPVPDAMAVRDRYAWSAVVTGWMDVYREAVHCA